MSVYSDGDDSFDPAKATLYDIIMEVSEVERMDLPDPISRPIIPSSVKMTRSKWNYQDVKASLYHAL